MVLRVKPTLTRFPTNSLYTPMDNTPLHSISSVCYPWGGLLLSVRTVLLMYGSASKKHVKIYAWAVLTVTDDYAIDVSLLKRIP